MERRFRDAVDAGVPSAEFITVGGGTSTAPGVTPPPPGSALYPRFEAAPRELERGGARPDRAGGGANPRPEATACAARKRSPFCSGLGGGLGDAETELKSESDDTSSE
mmetsp:Transcript_14207/g.33658  ORF Transcript_14207/g.33658 Transcript_14207/m.33658 type:complete len:108 (+) Transcript_14207:44-367(+)